MFLLNGTLFLSGLFSGSWFIGISAFQGHAHSKDPVIQLVAVQLPQARHQGREFRDTSVHILLMAFGVYLYIYIYM